MVLAVGKKGVFQIAGGAFAAVSFIAADRAG
jgi:hypothetical protein